MSQRVAIVGYGVEGSSAYRYFAAKGDEVTIFDERQPAEAPPGARIVVGSFGDFTDFDVVVRTPSIPPDRLHTNGRLTSVVKEFLTVFGTKRVIGVTGSKGKGTVSSYIERILANAGIGVHLAGNIGVSALDLLPKVAPDDYVVLELSSFQLWDVEVSPHIAVLLMIEPEHLDVHADLQEYISAKANITAHQNSNDVLVYLPSNNFVNSIANTSRARKIPYTTTPGALVQDGYIVMDGQRVIATDQLGLVGQHNVDNACAAITATWQITQNVEAMRKALAEFKGLPHRLQFVREVAGVKYYDDSIATTPGSAIAALRSFAPAKVIILGGSDKGADFTELAQEVAHQKMRGVILIGDMQDKMYAALNQAGVSGALVHSLGSSVSMRDIVARVHGIAKAGDVVILSPACASFGMFQNYKDRGEQFVTAVKDL